MERPPRPREGDALTEWWLKPLDRQQPPQLIDLQGQYVLLLFYNLGCAGCMGRGLPLAQRIQDLYTELRVILIHSDFGRHTYPAEDIRQATEARITNLEQYRDQEHRTYDAFGAEGTPHWILLDPEGRIHRTFFGSTQAVQVRMDYVLREIFDA